MRRTQLYLEDSAWSALRTLARTSGSTVSELVRQAVREKYLGAGPSRGQIFESVIDLWKDRDDLPDTETYIRNIRKDTRWKRLRR